MLMVSGIVQLTIQTISGKKFSKTIWVHIRLSHNFQVGGGFSSNPAKWIIFNEKSVYAYV